MLNFSFRPFAELSVYVSPPESLFLGMLRGYLDDSGDPSDPNCRVAAFAGYVARVSAWRGFESDWTSVLAAHGAPWLHMKELNAPCDRRGPESSYAGWTNAKRDAFLADIVAVIESHKPFAVGAVVRLDDLQKFNSERGLDVQARPLALYSCMQTLYVENPNAAHELFIDNVIRAWSVMDEAEEYAETSRTDNVSMNINVNSIGKCNSFRTIIPVQAADFAAYEAFRYNKASDWTRATSMRQKRKSFESLIAATEIHGGILDYQFICDLDRHRGGMWRYSDPVYQERREQRLAVDKAFGFRSRLRRFPRPILDTSS